MKHFLTYKVNKNAAYPKAIDELKEKKQRFSCSETATKKVSE
jgi:hypothetical protein